MILSRELSNNPMGVGFSQGNECMLVDRFAISLIIGEQKIVQNKCKINLISLVKVKYISLSGLCYNFVVFSSNGTKKLEEWAKRRMIQRRRTTASEEMRFLITQPPSIRWGEGRILDKHEIIRTLIGVGVLPQMGQGNDSLCMRKYL